MKLKSRLLVLMAVLAIGAALIFALREDSLPAAAPPVAPVSARQTPEPAPSDQELPPVVDPQDTVEDPVEEKAVPADEGLDIIDTPSGPRPRRPF
jgi:hypothetical protein